MIQIDMEMPAKCSECRMRTDYDYCSAMPKNFCGNTEDDGKPEWCPLQEVPSTNDGKWISVKEKPPDDHEHVFIYSLANGIMAAIYTTSGQWVGDDGYYVDDVTHWMPLLKPPKE